MVDGSWIRWLILEVFEMLIVIKDFGNCGVLSLMFMIWTFIVMILKLLKFVFILNVKIYCGFLYWIFFRLMVVVVVKFLLDSVMLNRLV